MNVEWTQKSGRFAGTTRNDSDCYECGKKGHFARFVFRNPIYKRVAPICFSADFMHSVVCVGTWFVCPAIAKFARSVVARPRPRVVAVGAAARVRAADRASAGVAARAAAAPVVIAAVAVDRAREAAAARAAVTAAAAARAEVGLASENRPLRRSVRRRDARARAPIRARDGMELASLSVSSTSSWNKWQVDSVIACF